MEFLLPLLFGFGVLSLFSDSSSNNEPEDSAPDTPPLPTNGNDTVVLTDGADLFLGADGNDSIDGGAGFDTLSGEDGNDTIEGGYGKDELFGGDGSDILSGGAWHDTLDGGSGDDDLDGGPGKDTLFGGSGNDLLEGGDERDEIWGGDDPDFVDGGAERDIIYGGNGNDTLLGGDSPASPTNDDPLSVENPGAVEQLFGGNGDDLILGGAGEDRIEGGAGNDVLIGSDFAAVSDEIVDLQRGTLSEPTKPVIILDEEAPVDTDADVLLGGEGNDTFILGGKDVAFGGVGNDVFAVGIDWIGKLGAASIGDFDIDDDVLVIGYDADDGPPTLTYYTNSDGLIEISANGNVVVKVDSGGGSIDEFDVARAVQVLPVNPADGL